MIVFPDTLRRAVNVLNDCALAKEAVRFDELFVGSPMIVKVAGRWGSAFVREDAPKLGEAFRFGPAFSIH
jgi:hypothetical protein